jgi:hypothetical protein
MWRKRKTDKKKKDKEESLLEELCGDDAELYDFLARRLYMDPIEAMSARGISEKDLEILIGEAKKSIKDKNYEEAMWKYRLVVDKAILEATQNPWERGRFIKTIRDVASKAVHATEKAKEKAEKEGLTDHTTSLGRRIENYEFMSKRIEDVINVASHFYKERLETLGEQERRAGRIEKMQEMGKEEKEEAEREEKRIEERETERREARRTERRGARKKELR